MSSPCPELYDEGDELMLYSDALSSFVRSNEGKQAQVKVWKELLVKLERIAPGISGNLAN